VHGLNHASRQSGIAALAVLECAADGDLAGGVPAVLAALTLGTGPGDEQPDVLGVELVEPPLAQARDQVEPDDALIALVGLGTSFLTNDVLEPVVQVVADGPARSPQNAT
jgi:hypothetical protein